MGETPEKKKSKTVIVTDSVEISPAGTTNQNLGQTKREEVAKDPTPKEEIPVKSPSVQIMESPGLIPPQDEDRRRRTSLSKASNPQEENLPRTSSLVLTDSSGSIADVDRPKRKRKRGKRSASKTEQLPKSSSYILSDSSASIIDEGRPKRKKKSKRSRSKEGKLAKSSSTLLSDSSDSLCDEDSPRRKKKPKRSKSKEGKLSKSSSTQLTGSTTSVGSKGRRKKPKKPRRSKSKEGKLSRTSSTQIPERPQPSVKVKPTVKGRVESCPGCKLDNLQDVKTFIYKDLPKYDGLTFKKGKGVGPELIILDGNNKVRERIPLQNKTRKQCNALLVEKGFKLKQDSMHSLMLEDRVSSNESALSLVS